MLLGILLRAGPGDLLALGHEQSTPYGFLYFNRSLVILSPKRFPAGE